jgi:hypothetical protein
MAKVVFRSHVAAAEIINQATTVEFGDWILCHVRDGPLALVFNGRKKPDFIYAEFNMDGEVVFKKVPPDKVILFHERVATFELYCGLRDLISLHDNEYIWEVIARMFACRLTSLKLPIDCG